MDESVVPDPAALNVIWEDPAWVSLQLQRVAIRAFSSKRNHNVAGSADQVAAEKIDLQALTRVLSRNVKIGTDRTTRADVVLPYDTRDEHVAMVGKTKSGKSSLLEHLILADLRAGTPAMVIDPHGDLAQRVMGLASRKDAKRIVHLDPSQKPIFGLNLLACSDPDDDTQVTWAADSVVATLKTLYGQADQFLPRLEKYLDLGARTLIPNGLTLADVPDVLVDEDFRKSCLENIRNLEVRADLQRRWQQYGQLRTPDQMTHLEPVANRLDRLLASQFMKQMVGSPETTVPFDEILCGDTILIISPSSPTFGYERFNLIGAMLLSEFASRVFARHSPGVKPKRVHLYIDEYERFATSTTAEMLTQGRKFGVGFTFVYQHLSQVTDEKIRGAARGTGTLIVGRVSRPDADQVVGEFPITPKPQSTEIREVRDGKKPVKVPLPTPISHLLMIGHRDPMVTDAARRLFAKNDNGGEADLSADDVVLENLFVDVMHGRAPNLQERLLDILYDFSEGQTSAWNPDWNFRDRGKVDSRGRFLYTSPSTVRGRTRYRGNLAKYDVPLPPHEPGGLPRYSTFTEWDKNAAAKARTALESWLKVYLGHEEAFCQGVTPTPWNPLSDSELLSYSIRLLHVDSVRVVDETYNPVTPRNVAEEFRLADDELLMFVLEHAKIGRRSGEWIKEMTHPSTSRRSVIATFRERMRCIVTICRGLAKEPILVNSGQEEDNYKQVVINHPEQSQQDAENVFANKRLVNRNPDEEWIAHVKLPIGYHEVKLAPPTEGKENRQQVDDIKTRQELYRANRRSRFEARPVEEATASLAGDTAITESVRLHKPIGRRSPKANT